jgi:hypothetical protein
VDWCAIEGHHIVLRRGPLEDVAHAAATGFLCESDAPLLLSLQLCSNDCSTVRSRHEHRPLNPLLGVGGFLAQFLYKHCSASRRSKALCQVRVSSINMNRACAAQSSQSLFQSKKFPQRHSRGASLTLSGQHAQSVSRRNQLPPVR